MHAAIITFFMKQGVVMKVVGSGMFEDKPSPINQ